MSRFTTMAFGLLLGLRLASGEATSVEKFQFWTPDKQSLTEDPDAPGTYGTDVTGNAKTGNWIMFVKFNPGAWANWHWHRNAQRMYVVSGTMNYEVKPHPVMKLMLGSYVVVPARALHNGTCISKEPCTFFIENPLPNDKRHDGRQWQRTKTALSRVGQPITRLRKPGPFILENGVTAKLPP